MLKKFKVLLLILSSRLEFSIRNAEFPFSIHLLRHKIDQIAFIALASYLGWTVALVGAFYRRSSQSLREARKKAFYTGTSCIC